MQAEKSALVRAIPPEGAVVLNADDARGPRHARARGWRASLTYGTSAAADVRAVGAAWTRPPRTCASPSPWAGSERAVRLAFAGRHNVVNALAAAGAGRALGLALDQIAAGLEAARPAKGRCVWRRSGGITILDDTYNANPSSVRAALDTLAAGAGAARRVVVLGDMLELGEGAEAAHREAGRAVAAAGVAEFIGVGPPRARRRRGGARGGASPRATTRPPSRTRSSCS